MLEVPASSTASKAHRRRSLPPLLDPLFGLSSSSKQRSLMATVASPSSRASPPFSLSSPPPPSSTMPSSAESGTSTVTSSTRLTSPVTTTTSPVRSGGSVDVVTSGAATVVAATLATTTTTSESDNSNNTRRIGSTPLQGKPSSSSSSSAFFSSPTGGDEPRTTPSPSFTVVRRPRRGTPGVAGGGARTSSYYSTGSSSSRLSMVDGTTAVTAGEPLPSVGCASSSPHPSPTTSHPSRVLHICIPSNSAPPPSPDQLAPRSSPTSTATTTRRTANSDSTLSCHPPYAGAPPDMLELSLGAVPGPTTVAPAARPNLGMRGVTASLSPSSSSPTSSFSGSPIPATTEMTSLFFPPRAVGRPSSQAAASSLSGPAEADGVLSPASTLRSRQCSSSTPTGGPFDHDGPRTASSDLLGNGLSLRRPPFAVLPDDVHHHHSLPLLLSDQQQQQSQYSSSSPSSPCPLGRANSAPTTMRRRRDAASPSPPASGNAFDSSTSSSCSCSSTTTTSDEAAGVNGVRIGANGPLTPGPPQLLHSPSGNSSTDTSALLAAFASARHHEEAVPVQSSSSSAKTTRPRSKTDLGSYDFPSAAPHFHLPARAALRPWPGPTNLGAASSSAVDHRDQRGAIIPDTVPIRAGSVFDPSDDEDEAGTARGVLPPGLVASSNGLRVAHDGNVIRPSMPRRTSSTRPVIISQRKSSLLIPKGKERADEAPPASSSACATLTAAASVAMTQPDKRVFKLWELVEGEVQYTEDLVTLVHVYLHHLYLLPSFCPSRRAIIARNTLDLLMLHKRFSKALVDVLAEEGIRPVAPPAAPLEERNVVRASRRIAAVFVHEAPDFAAYQEYCSGHDEALAVIREVELTPEWLAFERRCSALAASRTRPDLQILLGKAEEDTEVKPSSTSTTPVIFSKQASSAAPVAPSTARTDGVSSSIDANQSGRRTSMPPPIMATPPTPTLASTPSPASRLMLRDLLIKPIQRICRYPLVLTSLLGSQKAIAAAASSSDDDGDGTEDEGDDLENALGVMRAVAEGVDEATQSKANRARTNLIRERFEPHVSLTPAIIRALDECLLVGALDVIYQHATYAPLLPPVKVRYLAAFLFADYLVLAKVRKGRAYQALFYMSIRTMSIVDGASLGSETLLSDSVRLVGNGYSYELGTTCPREKQIWLSALRAAQSASSSSHKITFPTSAPEIFPPRIIARRMSSYNAGEVKEVSCTAAAAAAADGSVAGGSAVVDELNVIGGKRNSLPGLELSTSSFAEAASSDVSGFVSASSTPWTSRSPSALNSPTLSTFPLAPGSSGSSSSSAYPTSFASPMLNSAFALSTISGGGTASSAAPILFRRCSPLFREAVNRALADVMSESIATARSLAQLDRGFALDNDGGHLSLSFATMTNSPSRGSLGSAVDTVKRKMTPREGSHLSRRKSLIDLRVWAEGGHSHHTSGSSSATATKSMSVSHHHSHLTAMSPSSSASYSSTAAAGASAHPIPRTKSDLGLSRKDHFLRRASIVPHWPTGGDSSGNQQKSPIEMEESDVLRFSGPRGNAHAPIRAATVDMIRLTPLRDESSLSTSHLMEKSHGVRPPSSYQTMKASIKRRSSFVENWTSGGRSKSQPPSPAMSRRPLPFTELHSQPEQSPTLPPMPTAASEELAASPIGDSSMASSTVSLAGIVVPPSSMTANEFSLFAAGGRNNHSNSSSNNSSTPSLQPAAPTSLSRDSSPSVSRSNSRVSLAAWPTPVRKKSSASTSTSNVSVVQHDGSSGPPSASASVILSRPSLIQRSLSSISRRRTKSSPMGQPPPSSLDPELVARANDASGVSLSSGRLGVRVSSRLAPPAEGGAEATGLPAPVLSPLTPLSPFEVEGMTTTDEHGVQQMTTVAAFDQSLDTKDNTLTDFFTAAAARPASSSLHGSGGEQVQQQPETPSSSSAGSSPSCSTSDEGGAASAPLKKRRSLRWGAGFARSMGFTPLPNPST